MKYLIFSALLFVSSFANATLISVSLDKVNYQVNDTINGQILVSSADALLGGVWLSLGYDVDGLQMNSWTFGEGFDDGLGSYQFDELDDVAGLLHLSDYADLFADTSRLATNQGSGFVVANFSATALKAGGYQIALSDFGLVDFDNAIIGTNTQNAIFSVVGVTQVPEPATWSMLALALMVLRIKPRRSRPGFISR